MGLTWLPAITLGLLSCLAPALGDDEDGRASRDCSVASLQGTYGFYRSGTGPFGPVAGQGIGFLDGKGNFHAVVTNSRNGEISLDEEFSGTYTIAPDCTGAFLLDGVESDRFVVVDEGKGFYGVSVFEGITVNTVGTRIHTRHGHGRRGNDDPR
jgi:hypothetical protein